MLVTICSLTVVCCPGGHLLEHDLRVRSHLGVSGTNVHTLLVQIEN